MTPNIHTDTPLVCYIIAEMACENEGVEASKYLVDYLTERAERHYSKKMEFYRRINDQTKDQRKTLLSFMQHWLNPVINKTGAFAD